MNKPTLSPLPDIVSIQEDSAEADRSRSAGAQVSADILSIYTSGGPRYRLNKKGYRAVPPFAILLPEGGLDQDLQKGRIRGLCVLFKGNGLLKSHSATEATVVLGREQMTVPLLKELSTPDGDRLVSLLAELKGTSGAGMVARLRRTAKLFEAVAEYCFCPGRTGHRAVHREAIRLRELIQAFAFENTALEKVYEETNLSPAYIKTLFRRAFGITPVEYRIRLRLQRARELLSSSRMNVSQVAYAVGFNDPLYFSKLFSKTFGSSPSRFIVDFDSARKKALL